MFNQRRTTISLLVLITIFILVFVVLLKTVFPPADFLGGSFYHVDRGKSVSQIAEELEAKNFIQSSFAFKVFVRLLGGEKRLQVGTYFFRQPTSAVNLALKLTNHYLGYKPIVVTVYEGMSNIKIADLLVKKFSNFPREDFLNQAKYLEGRLFPDTYFFSPYNTVNDIIFEMNQNFNERIDSIKIEILLSGKTLNEILIMASIIEREVDTDEDRYLVSGILWKRLSIDMPLQVDVAKETYKEQGLPNAPIANPGLPSIKAAIHPMASDYLYYLTGRDGLMYYAEDFAGHKKNRKLYLE